MRKSSATSFKSDFEGSSSPVKQFHYDTFDSSLIQQDSPVINKKKTVEESYQGSDYRKHQEMQAKAAIAKARKSVSTMSFQH